MYKLYLCRSCSQQIWGAGGLLTLYTFWRFKKLKKNLLFL
jgi:hypothetical protein